jgi:hypothetical protein
MWGLPMFDLEDDAGAVYEVNRCREAYPNHYIRVNAYDASRGRQTTALQFIVDRPQDEPCFRLERQESHDRSIRYTLHPYAAEQPHGQKRRRRRRFAAFPAPTNYWESEPEGGSLSKEASTRSNSGARRSKSSIDSDWKINMLRARPWKRK